MYSIMIVDDDEVVRKKIKRLKIWEKEMDFYIAAEAENGYDALEKLKECAVDLVITDIRMTKINGIELLHKIMEWDLAPYVVLLSEYDEFYYAKEGFKHGALDYLVKPVKEEELSELLGKVKMQLMKREAQIEKIEALEQKLQEKVEMFYPSEQVKRIIHFIHYGDLQAVETAQELVDYVCEVVENDRTKTAVVLQNALQEILKATSEKYRWLAKIADKKIFEKVDFYSCSNITSMRTTLTDVVKVITTSIKLFEPEKDGIIKQVCDFVLENASNEIKVDTVSKNMYINKSYICKLFKQRTGMTVNGYITMVKMESAKRLLEEDSVKASNVANNVGYKDPDYFNKLFKKYYGLSPKDYKQQISARTLEDL